MNNLYKFSTKIYLLCIVLTGNYLWSLKRPSDTELVKGGMTKLHKVHDICVMQNCNGVIIPKLMYEPCLITGGGCGGG